MSRFAAVLILAQLLGAAAPEETRKEGRRPIGLHCALDLDDGESACIITLDGDGTEPPAHPSGKHFDFRFEPEGRRRYLVPRSGSVFALPSLEQRGLTGCRVAEFKKGKLRVDGLAAGSFVCARTGAGRYSEIEFVRIGTESVAIKYTTWNGRLGQ